jgi:hypothetical protein
LPGYLLFAFCSLLSSGCMSYLHPITPPPVPFLEACHEVPKAARDHVYIFLVHGLDPTNWANMTGLRDYCQSLGFAKTYYGQMYHAFHFEDELERIYHSDPDAHFVLIGFSFGANMVRDVAHDAGKANIPIDLMIYFGGNTLENTEHDQPSNVGRIINILASGCIWNGAEMDRAENVHVTDVWHFGSPTHKRSLEIVARELAVVAASVPVPSIPPEHRIMPFADEPIPPPRETHTSQKPGSTILTPVSRLKMPKSLEPPADPDKPPTPAYDRIAKETADRAP